MEVPYSRRSTSIQKEIRLKCVPTQDDLRETSARITRIIQNSLQKLRIRVLVVWSIIYIYKIYPHFVPRSSSTNTLSHTMYVVTTGCLQATVAPLVVLRHIKELLAELTSICRQSISHQKIWHWWESGFGIGPLLRAGLTFGPYRLFLFMEYNNGIGID